MKIIRCKRFPPSGYSAMALVWWLFVREKYRITPRLLNHEEIHSRQQKEILVVFFLLWYGLEFVFRLVQYRNWDKAYRNLSFEREAYAKQDETDYLASRRRFTWIHYLTL